jgi:hypothetical protein
MKRSLAVTLALAATALAGDPEKKPARPAPTTDTEEARRFLATVPAIEPRDDAETRQKTIDAVRARVALKALVAISAEPGLDRSHMTPAERRLALEVVAAAPAADVRPLLARALVARRFSPARAKDDPGRANDAAARAKEGPARPKEDPEEEVPPDLARLVARVSADDTGELERAVLAKAGALLEKGASIESLGPVFDAVATDATLAKLYEWLVAARTPMAAIPELTRTARELGARAPDRDRALRLLAMLVDPTALPDWPKLDAAFQLLGESSGEHASKVAGLLDAAESAHVVAEAEKAQRDCLATGRDALAKIGTPMARDRLLTSLSHARSEEERVSVLLSIGQVRAEDEELVPFLYRIVEFMAEHDRTAQELKLGGRALGAITHQNFGTDTRAWTQYLESLRR